MSGRRSKRKKIEGQFLALPRPLLDSVAFTTLSPASVCILLAVGKQYTGGNNGRLIATPKWLSQYGFNSHDTIARARRELVEHGFLFQTVQGSRPNRASWYALTWFDLDAHADYDYGTPAAFAAARGAYKRYQPEAKNAPLIPIIGTKARRTVPTIGHTTGSAIPPIGTMRRSA